MTYVPHRTVQGHNRGGLARKVFADIDGSLSMSTAEAALEQSRPMAEWIGSRNDIDFILGIAGRGIIPAFACALHTGLPFQIAYKNRLAVRPEVVIVEPHSMSREIYFYPDSVTSGMGACIVDDEITTGRTVAAAQKVLADHGIELRAAVSLLSAMDAAAVELLRSHAIETFCVSRVDGQEISERR